MRDARAELLSGKKDYKAVLKLRYLRENPDIVNYKPNLAAMLDLTPKVSDDLLTTFQTYLLKDRLDSINKHVTNAERICPLCGEIFNIGHEVDCNVIPHYRFIRHERMV